MNRKNLPTKLYSAFYQLGLLTKQKLPRRRCSAFEEANGISKIYVINLDRQPKRLERIVGETSQILDKNGKSLDHYLNRISAVDALDFENGFESNKVVDHYTLGEQIFVDPPDKLPPNCDLDESIGMSRQEVAIALSHVRAWEEVAHGPDRYVLVIEDDVTFSFRFGKFVGKLWNQLPSSSGDQVPFDLLYLSYDEVAAGAEKFPITNDILKLQRGVWFLSGYILSRRGAEKLLDLLPVRGPVDLWINHQFAYLEALIASQAPIRQRKDEKSQNSYSVLPTLARLGVLENQSLGQHQPNLPCTPVVAIGGDEALSTSLAMGLSMLGYRCCSDLETIPAWVDSSLLGESESVFNAYVNVGCITSDPSKLPFWLTRGCLIILEDGLTTEEIDKWLATWRGRVLILDKESTNRWKPLCEFLQVPPPATSYPRMGGIGRRSVEDFEGVRPKNVVWLESDLLPWILPKPFGDSGIVSGEVARSAMTESESVNILDSSNWTPRSDTFPGNLALFSPANVMLGASGLELWVKREDMGVRKFSGGALTSNETYLTGRFEAVMRPSAVTGVITGLFLHRNTPRQEIDIEFLGKDTSKMLVNVFYNPGVNGSRLDHGYRGTPVLIDLGFDASKSFHAYAIEWSLNRIRWFVDGVLVHERVNWNPTPIPHLPMSFHLNHWPTMAAKLGGKINPRQLPVKAEFLSAKIRAKTEE